MIQIDMEMPENCLKCPMQFGGWCYVSPPEVDERVAPTVDEAWEQGKPDWCPLIDVPEMNVGNITKEQPEIILCKDCAYVDSDATCSLVCGRKGMGLKPYHVYHDDYCSYAERKTDDCTEEE